MKRGRRKCSVLRKLAGECLRPFAVRLAKRLPGVAFVGYDGKTILERYALADNLPFGISVRLHHIIGKDPDPNLFHDHPWSWSLAVVLAGSYVETMPNPWATHPFFERKAEVHDFIYHFLPLSINPILHDTFHHLTELPDGDAWTLYVNGPRWQPDGFMRRVGAQWSFYPMTPNSRHEHVVPIPAENVVPFRGRM